MAGAGASSPVSSINIFDATGALVTVATPDASGVYATTGLRPGAYYVSTKNTAGYVDELYNDIACLNCIPTVGMPVSVTTGSNVSGINLALSPGGRISGSVTDAATAAALKQVTVEIYNSSGALVTTGVTDCSGNYVSQAGMPTGAYFARTTNSREFIDKLNNNVNCEICNPTTGTPISVTSGLTTGGINFSLCPLIISPGSNSIAARGGEGVIDVTSSGGCGWTAVSTAGWIEITSGASGTGNGTIMFVVQPNSTGATRTGTISVGGRKFNVKQAAN